MRRIAFHHVPAHLWLDHYRCVGAETLKQHLAEAGIAVDVFHPGRYHYSLFASAGTRQDLCTREYLRRCMDVASSLGCTTVCLQPDGALIDDQNSLSSLCRQLSALCGDAVQYGVTLCLQTVTPEDSAILHTLPQLLTVLDAVPELAAALDTVPVSLAGESIPQWFDKLGQRIRFVRFQDGRGCYGRIWGQGVFPSQDYAHQLLHSGYSGLVSINGLSTRYQEDPAAADRRNRAAVLAMLSGKEESSLLPPPAGTEGAGGRLHAHHAPSGRRADLQSRRRLSSEAAQRMIVAFVEIHFSKKIVIALPPRLRYVVLAK